jgi:hypothetical protein
MIPFQQALKRHTNVTASARIDVALAGDLWSAVTGQGAREGTFAEAVSDTMPAEHATLLVASDVAAAYAFQLCWERWADLPRNASPLVLRDSARAAWTTFAERATSTQEMARGFGARFRLGLVPGLDHARERDVQRQRGVRQAHRQDGWPDVREHAR